MGVEVWWVYVDDWGGSGNDGAHVDNDGCNDDEEENRTKLQLHLSQMSKTISCMFFLLDCVGSLIWQSLFMSCLGEDADNKYCLT